MRKVILLWAESEKKAPCKTKQNKNQTTKPKQNPQNQPKTTPQKPAPQQNHSCLSGKYKGSKSGLVFLRREPLQVFYQVKRGWNLGTAFLETLRVIQGSTRRKSHVQTWDEYIF